MDHLSQDEVMQYMTQQREAQAIYCDIETRKQRKLIKAVSVLDFSGFSLLRGNDSRFQKCITEGSKLSEKLYPQMLGKSIFSTSTSCTISMHLHIYGCKYLTNHIHIHRSSRHAVNTPRIFNFTFSLIKPLMSKRAVEKMVFCPGFAAGSDVSVCPYLSKYMNLDTVPTFLGGKCNCPGGCIGNVPNSQTVPVNEISADGSSSMTIAARTAQTLELPVCKGNGVEVDTLSEKNLYSQNPFPNYMINRCYDQLLLDFGKDET